MLTTLGVHVYLSFFASKSQTFHLSKISIRFLVAYFIAITSDWIMSPNQFPLLMEASGSATLVDLYIVQYASAAIGTLILPTIADRYGRRLLCMIFCIFYCCASIMSTIHSFSLVLISRIAAGLGQVILFTTFDSWLASAHVSEKLSDESLSSTYEAMGVLSAISAVGTAGFCSVITNNVLNDQFMSLAFPNYVACVLAVVAFFTIPIFMRKEYVASRDESDVNILNNNSLNQVIRTTIKSIYWGFKLNPALICHFIYQSAFESTVYSFIFYWWGVIDEAARLQSEEINSKVNSFDTNVFFAAIMACCMTGCFTVSIIRGISSNISCHENISEDIHHQLQNQETYDTGYSVVEVFKKNYMLQTAEFYKHKETKRELKCLTIIFLFSALSLSLPLTALSEYSLDSKGYTSASFWLAAIGFSLHEICYGAYLAIMPSIRARMVPDTLRSTISNLMSLPAYIIVCGLLKPLMSEDVKPEGQRSKFLPLVATTVAFSGVASISAFCSYMLMRNKH